MKSIFRVTGMRCASCQAHVTKAVSAVDGVSQVEVNLLTGIMTAEHEDRAECVQKIEEAVNKLGFKVHALEDNAPIQLPPDESRELLRQFLVSLAFLILLMAVTMGLHPQGGFLRLCHGLVQFCLAGLIIGFNRRYFIDGGRRLIRFAPDMNSLIALGSGASMVYSCIMLIELLAGWITGNQTMIDGAFRNLYFETAGMILVLITFGKYLEAKAKHRTTDAIAKLINLVPKTATIQKNGKEAEIPVSAILPNDVVVIKPGMTIPADGTVIEGSGLVDESAITGESIPASKEAGNKVISGTVNENGSFLFRVEQSGKETTLAKITALVENAANSGAPVARFADKVSAVFVPVVLFIAIAAGVSWHLYGETAAFCVKTAIAVLVISCPCALGLATPVAIMVGSGVGSKYGILFKNGAALEELHKVQTVVLDKTGTVTDGKHHVIRAATFGEKQSREEENRLLGAVSALESHSEHPFAKAFLRYAESFGITGEGMTVTEFEAMPGFGVSGSVDGRKLICGNRRFLERNGIRPDAVEQEIQDMEQDGCSLLFAADMDEKKLLAAFALSDLIKEGTSDAVHALMRMGIDVVLLTGDTRAAAENTAKKLGIKQVFAGAVPEEKVNIIRKISAETKKSAVMIGDGINDAAALACADVGIAIGSGTDIALETADVILIRSDLRDAVTAIKLSHAVIRNIKINLFWAFFYNVLGIPIAAGALYLPFGWQLHPAVGTAAMACSSIFVVTNALRLRKFKGAFY